MKMELKKIGNDYSIHVDGKFKTIIPADTQDDAEKLFDVYVSNQKYRVEKVTSEILKTVIL